jgi:Protein of unknown function (DUF1579)
MSAMTIWAALLAAITAPQQSASPTAPPAPPPPCSAPEYRQMDFWVGDWDISFDAGGGKTGTATNRVTRDEYGSCFVVEHFYQPDMKYVGLSHSTYDRFQQQWVQTWVDNQGGYYALAGGPVEGQKHSFELKTIDKVGPKQLIHRMIWQHVKPDSLLWRWQALQADGSWADQWVLNYKRRK